MTTDIWTEWIVWAQDLLGALSLVTLGQVWRAIYNPPTPLNLSIAAVVIAYKLPEYWRRWQSYRLSRRVVSFQWPAPKVSESNPVEGELSRRKRIQSGWEGSSRTLQYSPTRTTTRYCLRKRAALASQGHISHASTRPPV